MELQDYLRMLRRGWPAVVLITALFVGLAAFYLTVAPKRYESTTVLLVSANDPRTIEDLQSGREFAVKAATTYAEVVDSATVLGPVAGELRPQGDVDDLVEMVTTVVPEGTTLINLTVAGDDGQRVTTIANAAAASATRIIPTLDNAAQGPPLVRVQQIRPGVEPDTAISPNVKKVLALGFIVGVCVGLGATIAAQTLDTRIRRIDDIRELTEVPVLAALPNPKRGQRQGLAVRDDPAGGAGEAYRTLRTNLRFLELKERRSLVFTAVADDRNGAQVPTNLAWSLAQAGRRVLLVDLDMRQSTVGDALGIKPEFGLADVLTGEADLADVVHVTQHARLRVVLSGSAQASPSDLLSAPVMTSVLRRMEQEYDVVILHAPPLLSYTDAAVVSGAAGGTLVTVTGGRTRTHELTTALSALANVWVKPVGMVLTGARRGVEPVRGSGSADARQTAVPAASTVARSGVPQPTTRVPRNDRHATHVTGRHTSNGAARPTPTARPRPPV